MEIKYKRELKHNYLIITPEDNGYDSYEVRMMASNGIEGLLKFYLKQVDNRKSYYYEITSKQPLTRILEVKSLGAEELGRLITGIVRTLERMETYLLQEGQILLDPDFIYVDPDGFAIFLCLVPGRQGVFPEEMTALLQYLLGKVNHQDKECVVMAYGLYQESLKENYGMENLLRLTGRNKAEEAAYKQNEAEKNEAIKRFDTQRAGEVKEEVPPLADASKKEEQSGAEWEDYGRRENRVRDKGAENKSGMLRSVLITCAVIAGGPVLCWFLYGTAGLKSYWAVLAAVDMAAVVWLVFRIIMRRLPGEEAADDRLYGNDNKKERVDEETGYQWQMVFKEETEDERPQVNEGRKNPPAEAQSVECSTVLLTETVQPAGAKRLRSMDGGAPDIIIAYVPFIIGKQEGLADYVLARDTVSRIHARIDREGDEYRITDLNSTNGTMVGGKLLEMNETVVLMPGDEVYIANIGFLFT